MSATGTLEPEHPVWVKFAKAMAPAMAMPAQLIAQFLKVDSLKRLKVLDISASHGLFGIAIAQHNPHAEIFAVDWAPVLAVAEENARACGVSERYHTIAGSAFEVDYGKDCDLVLLPNFLHHFDPATCEILLKKIYDALADGGRVVTFEFIPNEDRITPPEAAAFSLTMLATTPSGDAYTFAEYEQMFGNAGFNHSELHLLPNLPQQVVISYK
ncbi:methyltransferase [Tolypothrix bouteillei VB521301_2]